MPRSRLNESLNRRMNEWLSAECRESRLNAVINSVNWNRTFKRCFKHFFAVKQRCQGWDNLFYLILELLPIQDKMIYGHNCDCLYKSQNIKKSLFTTFEQSGECVSRTTIKPANRVMSAECRYHDITQLLCFYLNKWLHKTHSTMSFNCDQCDKVCKNKSGLTLHKRVHK